MLHIFSNQENEIKYKMHDFKYENKEIVYENNVKNKNIYHPCAHFIVNYNSPSVFTL